MYVRFQGRRGGGIFGIAYDVRDLYRHDIGPRRLNRAEGHEFDALLSWLSSSTPVVPSEVFRDPLCRNPRCWFKPTAEEHIRCCWRLIVLMRKARVFCRPYFSRNPGEIIWQDEVQVVVRPARTFRPPRRHTLPRRDAWKGNRETIRRWRFDADAVARAEALASAVWGRPLSRAGGPGAVTGGESDTSRHPPLPRIAPRDRCSAR